LAQVAAALVLQVADAQPVPMVEIESGARKVPERDWSAPRAAQALPAQERQCEQEPVASDSVVRSAPVAGPPGERAGEQERSARLVCLQESASPPQEQPDGLY
jgi:hypothetical protein